MSETSAWARKLAATRNNYEMFGLWQTVKDGIVYLLEQRRDDFDRRYGVETSQCMEAKDAQIDDDVARENAIRYVPTREPVLRHILRSVSKDRSLQRCSFVDLGCGQGRTLVIASQFPFARVLGVEISPLHARSARDNVQRYLRHPSARDAKCRSIDVHCANAAEFDLPDSDLLVYLYRPFVGPVFHAVAERLERFRERTGRDVLIAFSCPEEDFLLGERPAFTKIRECGVISSEYSWSLWRCQPAEEHRDRRVRAAGKAHVEELET